MSNQHAQDAISSHLSYLAQDENNLSLLVKISDLYLESGDLNAAQNYLNKANLINREACLGHQGLLHLNQGQFTEATETFLEALSHDDTPALRYNLGFSYFMNSEPQKAGEILSSIMDEEHYSEAKLLMARILHGQQELDKAINLVNEVLARHSSDAEALGLLALLHFDNDEAELASEAALQALKLSPENYDALLVNIMTRLAAQEVAAEEIEHLLQINPQDSRLWFALGSVHMSQGNLEMAESTLKRAVEIYPAFYDCYIALGWCQLLNNHLNEAQNTYQIAADLVAELSDSWGGLALVHALQENFLEAEQLLKKAKELNSDCFLTEIAETIYYNHHNPEQAKQHLVNALKNSKVPVSEKLAFIIEDMQGQTQFH